MAQTLTNPQALSERWAVQGPASVVSPIARTRLAFIALCLFVISQAYTVPVLQVGPSWAVHPGLPDITITLLFGVVFFTPNFGQITPPSKLIRKVMLVSVFAFILSFVIVNIWFRQLKINDVQPSASCQPGKYCGDSFNYGVFHVIRLVQAALVFWAVTRIPLSPQRLTILKGITTVVLVFVSVACLLTYLEIVPTTTWGGHLSTNYDFSGPWAATYLRNSQSQGLGTIGYNHGYVGAHIAVLFGLRAYLGRGKDQVFTAVLLLLATAAVFASSSRAGFVSMLFIGALLWIRKPIQAGVVAVVVASSVYLFAPPDLLSDEVSSTLDRQLTAFNPAEGENLSGRTDIWARNFKVLSDHPTSWLWGTGIGTSQARRSAAHNVALQYVMETGIIGLIGFLTVAFIGFTTLWKYEPPPKAFFIMTLGTFITGFSQEVFYPTAAFLYFLSTYMGCMGIVLQSAHLRADWSDPETSPDQIN